MALVFQYGSNMSAKRLNSGDRLKGDAHFVGTAITKDAYEFAFAIWSESKQNQCAAADIIEGSGRRIWGVVYEIADDLIKRGTAEAIQRKSLDAIEGEGKNYQRIEIKLRWRNGRDVMKPVITYTGLDRKKGIKTSLAYVQHILKGLAERKIPTNYVKYVKARIIENNQALRDVI